MLKNILVYALFFTALFLIGYNAHDYFIEHKQIELIFSLRRIYLFHALFSWTVCVVFAAMSNKERLFQQLGFIYLGALILKIVVFCIIFYNPILTTDYLTKTNSISLLIPLGGFLFSEVYFIAKILNRK